MSKYRVTLYATTYKVFEVEADDDEDAAELGRTGDAGDPLAAWTDSDWKVDEVEEVGG